MTQRERRTFTSEFKQQMVELYLNGKPRKDIIREYELTPSALDKWIRQSKTSGSFKEKDNLTPEQEELIRLRKENKQLLMENDIFKASCADNRTKVNVIRNNAHKYSISAMCSVLQLPRSTYYYEAQEKQSEDELVEAIQEIFHNSRNTYGTRKIKFELKKRNMIVSRRKIGRIMREVGLVSVYTVAQYKPHVDSCNESKVENELNRQFQQEEHLAVVVSDLTYVRVEGKWQYVCLLVDLFNREIIGHSAGAHKDAQLVHQAIASVQGNLSNVQMFHTDRGSEFKNKLIDEALTVFQIRRSLSLKGCPYDNAVAEATFKIFKTEFVQGRHFDSLKQLKLELDDYVHWYNHIRIHGTLGYSTPIEYKSTHLKKVV
ncbi:IS3 family transposase [Alicyclobacillus fastidiosus]|uniref:IS3 family transposase n=1 Tax=Alicyclobacillus fastidiosus TaxID=392011 RepID=UPI0023B847D0|nr:IS3 family transposase [Alicyclobacillus fastidiosus]WEH07982.1 IS3 family transposase [Alicyclobacillus fastidiosus]WEH11089.1 IS3 family transposase [Alicyclobacillus fastidiosus]